MIDLKAERPDGASVICSVAELPDFCPICKHNMSPEIKYAYLRIEEYGGINKLEIILRCTNGKCKHLFAGYFSTLPNSRGGVYHLNQSGMPYFATQAEFDKVIGDVSSDFLIMYNQSLLAEKNGLDLICGPGYRKALEFLIKDYLIKNGNKKSEIEDLSLAAAIEKIPNENIKICAEKAAWLGNDHSHYKIKFADKDLSHLKDLIDSVQSWIVLTEKTQNYKKIKSKNK